jgi:hypothetical protein
MFADQVAAPEKKVLRQSSHAIHERGRSSLVQLQLPRFFELGILTCDDIYCEIGYMNIDVTACTS